MVNTYLNACLFITLFLSGSLAIWATQSAGWSLRYLAPSIYSKLVARQKRKFAILLVAVSHIFTRTRVQFFLPSSVTVKTQPNGNPKFSLKKRAVLIANHQLYNDWIYEWWMAYTVNAGEAPIIMLKDSIKKIPIFGWAAASWNFLYMARNWKIDEPRILKTMKMIKAHPERPYWLLMFPEGTVTSSNTVKRSKDYAEKLGIAPMRNVLVPRVKGLQACLQGLDGDIDTLYDFTIYYDGVPEGKFGEDFYTLGRMYFQGKYPKVVKIHMREFAVKNIPLDDDAFTEWLFKVWKEKDEIMQTLKTDSNYTAEYMVKLNSWWDLFTIYTVPVAVITAIVAIKWAS